MPCRRSPDSALHIRFNTARRREGAGRPGRLSHSLHAPSLYLASALIEAIAALLMLRALRAQRDRFLSCWAAHAAIFAVSSAMVGLQGRIAPPVLLLLA